MRLGRSHHRVRLRGERTLPGRLTPRGHAPGRAGTVPRCGRGRPGTPAMGSGPARRPSGRSWPRTPATARRSVPPRCPRSDRGPHLHPGRIRENHGRPRNPAIGGPDRHPPHTTPQRPHQRHPTSRAVNREIGPTRARAIRDATFWTEPGRDRRRPRPAIGTAHPTKSAPNPDAAIRPPEPDIHHCPKSCFAPTPLTAGSASAGRRPVAARSWPTAHACRP